MFNQNYKNQKAMIENDINFGRKKYEDTLKQTKYDILKTYQEKGLALTKDETRELNTLVKNATRNGDVQKWDEYRAAEQKRMDEMNAKWNTPEVNEAAADTKNATVIRLDLGDKLHKKVVKEETVREAPQKEKEIEKEQKPK